MPASGRRRALGQHFLSDRNIAQKIAETTIAEAAKAGCTALLEVGPGKGAITEPLLERLAQAPTVREFILAERDAMFVGFWKNRREYENLPLRVEEGDFNELPEDRWLASTPLGIASNLPYSAGTAIMTRLARHADKIPFMVLMFQAEVAQRLRAEQGTKSWGSLSVWVQNHWDVRRLIAVPPGAFSPPPEVDSEVVLLSRRETPHVPISAGLEDQWDSLLRVAFAHRRKMLRSGLPSTGPWRNALAASGVDATKRSEALNWIEWRKLFEALSSSSRL